MTSDDSKRNSTASSVAISHSTSTNNKSNNNNNEYYRYFRIIQHGKNKYRPSKEGDPDEWGDVLATYGFELFGNLQEDRFFEEITDQHKGKAKYVYKYDLDGNGNTTITTLIL